MSFSANDHKAMQGDGSVVRTPMRLARKVLILGLGTWMVLSALSACGQRAPLLLPNPATAASGTVSTPGSQAASSAHP